MLLFLPYLIGIFCILAVLLEKLLSGYSPKGNRKIEIIFGGVAFVAFALQIYVNYITAAQYGFQLSTLMLFFISFWYLAKGDTAQEKTALRKVVLSIIVAFAALFFFGTIILLRQKICTTFTSAFSGWFLSLLACA